MKKFLKYIVILLGTLGLFTILEIGSSYILLLFNGVRDFESQKAADLMYTYAPIKLLILWLIALPLIFLFGKKRSSEPSFKNQAYFLKKDTDFSPAKAAILGGGYAFFATLLQGTVISSMENIPWTIGTLLPVGIYDGMPIFQIIITILILGVVVPIGEEYLFRGIGFRESKRLFSPLAAIILSAIPFTLAHMGGINIYHAGFLGILLAALYYYTGNISYPIIAHITNNIFAQLIQANQTLYWIILVLAALCFILSIKYLMEFKNYKSHPEFDIVRED